MPTRPYHDYLIESLKDKEEAAAYLKACFDDSEEIFMIALRDVVEARLGIAVLSKKTNLNRETLYRTLSKKGNPKLSSLSAILKACGIKMEFAPIKPKSRPKKAA